MKGRLTSVSAALFMAAAAGILGSGPAGAGGYCSDLALSCENGRTYPLCPIAVSEEGEVVTAHLVLGPGRGTHVRLIPLGNGYRYAGRGIWFDGIRQEATLNFGPRSSIQCTVLKQ